MCVSSVKPLRRLPKTWLKLSIISWHFNQQKESFSAPIQYEECEKPPISCQTCQTCTYQDFKLQTINLHLNHADSLRYLPVLKSWLHVQESRERNMIAPSILILIITWCGWWWSWQCYLWQQYFVTISDFKGKAVSSCLRGTSSSIASPSAPSHAGTRWHLGCLQVAPATL